MGNLNFPILTIAIKSHYTASGVFAIQPPRSSLYSFRGVHYVLGRRVRRIGPPTPKIPLLLLPGSFNSALGSAAIIQNVILWQVL